MKRSIYEHFICFILVVISLLNIILVVKLNYNRIEIIYTLNLTITILVY